jgi:hypothetical protein
MGVSASGLAILADLPDDEVARVVEANASRIEARGVSGCATAVRWLNEEAEQLTQRLNQVTYGLSAPLIWRL